MVGIALMRKFGWKTNLRNPHLEVMNIHLDFYTTASSAFHTFQVGLTSAIKSMSTWIQQPASLQQPKMQKCLTQTGLLGHS